MSDHKSWVSQRQVDEILALMREGRKIASIRLLREETGVGLAEAKETVEQIAVDHGMTRHGGDYLPGATPASGRDAAHLREIEVPARLRIEVQEHLAADMKIMAIKRFREETGLGLKEAKEAVEEIEKWGGGPVRISVPAPAPSAPTHAPPPEPEYPPPLPEPATPPPRVEQPYQPEEDRREDERDEAAYDDEALRDEVIELLAAGQNRKALRRYMAVTGEPKLRAKAAVDHLALTTSVSRRGSACFIATACYGSINAPEVVALRSFRDRRLLASRSGRSLVWTYYLLSPPLAGAISGRPWLRRLIRARLLAPLVKVIGRGEGR